MNKFLHIVFWVLLFSCSSTNNDLVELKNIAIEKLKIVNEINSDLEIEIKEYLLRIGSEEKLKTTNLFLKESNLLQLHFQDDTFLIRYNAAIDTLNKHYTCDFKHFSKIQGEDSLLMKLRFSNQHYKILKRISVQKNFEFNVYNFPRVVADDTVSFLLSLSYHEKTSDYTKNWIEQKFKQKPINNTIYYQKNFGFEEYIRMHNRHEK